MTANDRGGAPERRTDDELQQLRSIRTALWVIAALLLVLLVVVYVGFDNLTSV